MNLKEILELKYPEETAAGLIRCNSKDSTTFIISTWDVPFNQPTQQELDLWGIEFDLEYRQKQVQKTRSVEYPPINELVVALWEKLIEGDDIKAIEVQDKRLEVKIKNPKPAE